MYVNDISLEVGAKTEFAFSTYSKQNTCLLKVATKILQVPFTSFKNVNEFMLPCEGRGK